MQPPYLVGMTCGFCHIGFNPINPPADPERPTWANLAGTIGNQYWEEGKLFSLNMKPDDFRWHVAARQPPGTSDTSRFATDHINNPNAINTIFNLTLEADRARTPARRHDAPGASHPEGRRRFNRRGRRVAARLREHRHVRRLLGHAPRSGARDREETAAVRHRLRAQELPGLAQHGSADGQRRGLPEDA